jgi:UDP:flavonoid glycosyltransferase YjiC (YdhE family)
MRIVIIAAGTYGDVPPVVALGLGLRQAGHHVRVATYAEFGELVQSRGLEFFPLRGNPQAQQQQQETKDMMESVGNVVSYTRHAIRLHLSYMDQLLVDSWLACRGAEAIVYAINTLGGRHIAEKLRVPCYTFWYHPLNQTSAFPHPLISARLRLGGPLNRASYVAFEQFAWQCIRPTINRWRRETLDLPPAPRFGGSPAPFSSPPGWRRDTHVPFLYGYSPSVAPCPADWPAWQRVTGFWFLDHASGWQPPRDLVDFLEAGPPPVYIGFGSMIGDNPTAMTEIVRKALRLSGRRAVLVTGWGGLSDADWPDTVYRAEWLPFDWLYPRVAAVVHHGGVGTLALGMRAGVPAVVIPFTRDELYWGWQVARLGVGPTPMLRKELTAEGLAAAIQAAAGDAEMRARAIVLGRRIRSEDGVARAVEAIDAML